MTDVGSERGCVSSDRWVYLPDICNDSNTTFTHITYSSPPGVELFTIPGWFMFFWMSAGKNLDFETALWYFCPSWMVLDAPRHFLGSLRSNFDATTAVLTGRATLKFRSALWLTHFVFYLQPQTSDHMKLSPSSPWLSRSSLPWGCQRCCAELDSLELDARGHISSTQTHQ